MQYHKDPAISRVIASLADELCQWERDTGRGSLVILVPMDRDEELVVVRNGKRLAIFEEGTVQSVLEVALAFRRADGIID